MVRSVNQPRSSYVWFKIVFLGLTFLVLSALFLHEPNMLTNNLGKHFNSLGRNLWESQTISSRAVPTERKDRSVEVSESKIKEQPPQIRKSNRYAIFTMVTDPRYMAALQTLGYSVSKWRKSDTDMVAMIMEDSTMGALEFLGLSAVGWTVLNVTFIKPPRPPAGQFKDQFTKLWLWNQTQYDMIMYMDGDMISLKPMDDLFRSLNTSFAACRDFGGGFWETFNAGFVMLRPNASEFQWFMQLLKEDKIEYMAIRAEQGWLNALKASTWFELSFLNNVETSVYYGARGIWNSMKPYIRALHQTNSKPFLWESADYDRNEEVNRISYDWYQEMVTTKGRHTFTVITAVPCAYEAKTKFNFPVIYFHVCIDEPMKGASDWKTWDKQSPLHIQLREIVCSLKDLKSRVNNSNHWSLMEKQIRERCAPAILEPSAMANPFLTYYYYWLDIHTLESSRVNSVVNLLENASKRLNYSLTAFAAVVVGSNNTTSNKSSCDRIIAFGGNRFAAHRLRNCHRNALNCQMDTSLLVKYFILKDESLDSRKITEDAAFTASTREIGDFCKMKRQC